MALLKRGRLRGAKKSRPGPVLDGPVNVVAKLKTGYPSAGCLREIGREHIMVYGQYAKAISVLTRRDLFRRKLQVSRRGGRMRPSSLSSARIS